MTGRFNFSKPSRRGPNDPWFRIGAVDVDSSLLVAAVIFITIIVDAFARSLLSKLVLWPADVRSGKIWQLLSWPFPNAGSAVPGQRVLWAIIMVAAFWYFGRRLEEELGRVRFLAFLGILTVVPAAIFSLAFSFPVAGFRWIELAVFVCFAIQYPRMPFFFGIPAFVVAGVIVFADALQFLGDGLIEYIWLLFISLIVAVLALRAFGLAENLAWVPKIKLPKRGGGGGGRKKRKGGANLSVVPRPSAAPPRAPVMSAEIDSLLDKISEHGIESLTPAERARLEEHSRKLRGDG